MTNTKSEDLFGRVMLSIAGTSLSFYEKDLISSSQVGGVIFFSRNFISRQQIADLCDEMFSIKANILIAVDQEGGRVQRFDKEFSKLPSMQELGDYSIKNNDYKICHDVGWLMSDNPNLVSTLAKKFIEGMNTAGMKATGKHFPGHGGIFEDSHITEPSDNRNYEDLLNRDIKPFFDLKDKLGAVMSAHRVFPKVDDKSVGFSSKWLKDILRQEINFNGLVFSDDLSMKGSGDKSFSSKAMNSIRVGCDMVLVCNHPDGVLEVVNYFEKENISLSEKIITMKKSKFPSWNDLINNKKRLEIHEIIKKIGD